MCDYFVRLFVSNQSCLVMCGADQRQHWAAVSGSEIKLQSYKLYDWKYASVYDQSTLKHLGFLHNWQSRR